MTMASDGRRKLPSVDALLSHEGLQGELRGIPRVLVRRAVRAVLDEERARWQAGGEPESGATVAAQPELVTRIVARARQLGSSGLRRVINATGVVVHTNLGRSPLSASAWAAAEQAARSYSTLEYDLATGRRGSRMVSLSELLIELTGAEDALVVNNNAAALVLALTTLAAGREVIVSRGELVEIGGSFRLPEILHRSGARLVEVGTTNKTRADDYRQAIGRDTAMLLKVHRSNFSMHGFVADVSLEELVEIGRERQVPVVEDLGSGALVDLAELGIGPEPTVQESIRTGAQLVTFSGDKLLGGPQAGILVGERAVVERLARDPLARALRLDKMTIAALDATLRAYLEPDRARGELPTLALLTRRLEALEREAGELAAAIGEVRPDLTVEVIETSAQVGGGAQPDARIPSWGVALTPAAASSAQGLGEQLRRGAPPVVGRIELDRLILELRTLLPGDADELVQVLADLGASPSGG